VGPSIRIAAMLALASIAAPAFAHAEHQGEHGLPNVWPRVAYPPARAIRSAQAFAAGRGDVSFALIDPSVGLRGYDADARYSSASVSKALLLAAELRRLGREDEPLDSATKELLEPMITYSDNDAADSIYARVGDSGLEDVASRAGMRDFDVTPGFWGGDQVTAADLARFFYRLDANFPPRYRAYAKRLLADITPAERWGIPQAIDRGWSIWFKGGWRPAGQEHTSGSVTHQAALLVHRAGERLALAVLTDEPPGTGAGFDAIEGVASRLLTKPPPRRGGWPVP
jgi:Beta-lactamase enzyme family